MLRQPTGNLTRPLRFLHFGFWGSVLSFGAALAVDALFPAGTQAPALSGLATNALLGVFLLCACVYWASLGTLAHRMGRSAWIWVGSGLATLAIGFIVTYALMAGRTRREIAAGNPAASDAQSS